MEKCRTLLRSIFPAILLIAGCGCLVAAAQASKRPARCQPGTRRGSRINRSLQGEQTVFNL
jgi:hypothetical protein